MKKLLILTILLSSVSTFARSLRPEFTVAKYRFAIVSDGAYVANRPTSRQYFSRDYTAYEVEITNEKKLSLYELRSVGTHLRVEREALKQNFAPQLRELIIEDYLSIRAFDELLHTITSLAQTKIITTRADVVCEIMPSPDAFNNHLYIARNYDIRTRTFQRGLELVSGAEGCWVLNATQPVYEHDRSEARILKRILKVLSLEKL